MALVTIASAAFAQKKSNDMIAGTNSALEKGALNEIEGRNKQIKEGMDRKRMDATILGGQPTQGNPASQGGTVLTSTQTKQSLLG